MSFKQHLKPSIIEEFALQLEYDEKIVNFVGEVSTIFQEFLSKKKIDATNNFSDSFLDGKKIKFPLQTSMLTFYDEIYRSILERLLNIKKFRYLELIESSNRDLNLFMLSLTHIPVFVITKDTILMNECAFNMYNYPDITMLRENFAPGKTKDFYNELTLVIYHKWSGLDSGLDILNLATSFAIYKNIIVAEQPLFNCKARDFLDTINEQCALLKDYNETAIQIFLGLNDSPYQGIFTMDGLIGTLIKNVISGAEQDVYLDLVLTIENLQGQRKKYEKEGKFATRLSQFFDNEPKIYMKKR